MKTKTQNSNTRNQNFFQKTFILLAILTFTSFGFKAKAQQVHLDVDNTSSCNWDVNVYSGLILKYSTTVNASTRLTGAAGCVTWSTGLMDRVTVTNGICTLTFNASGGIFPYTNYVSPCSGTTCSSSVDGSGSQSGTGCAVDGFMIIRIF